MAKHANKNPAQETQKETHAIDATGQNDAHSKETTQENAAPAPGMKLTPLSKLTVLTICGALQMSKLPPLFVGTLESPEPNPDKELKLCRIAGFASGTKTGVTQYGKWEALTGEFAATNFLTGEIFAGKTCLIPAAMGEALVTAVETALERDAGSKVRFSVDISVARSPREPDKKYVYFVRPVIEAELGSPALALLTMG